MIKNNNPLKTLAQVRSEIKKRNPLKNPDQIRHELKKIVTH